MRKLARVDDCLMHPLDGQARGARQKVDANPQHDGSARSLRAINDYFDPYKTPNLAIGVASTLFTK